MNVKLIILCLFFGCYALGAAGQWQQQEFVIGTYLDPTLSQPRNRQTDSLALALAKEARFNLLTGYRDDNYIRVDRSEAEIRYQLDLAKAVGLKMIVADDRFFHKKAYSAQKADEIQQFYLNLNQEYRNTIMGYRLMDEPIISDTAWTLPWVRFFNKIDPEKMSYINLLPVYGFPNQEKYDHYLKTYLADLITPRNRLPVVSYDFYPFLKNGVRQDYFYNLEEIRKYANGRPIWYYPNTATHLEYIEPTDNHLRFEAFCPLAYGAKGIIYFSYESVPKQSPYNYAEALISRQGKPTKKYYQVKKINTFLQEVAGPAIMNSNYIGTYHVSSGAQFNKIPSYQLLNPASPLLSHISDNNILTGIFQHQSNKSKYYILLVNKSLHPVKNLQVYFKGLGPTLVKKFVSDFTTDPRQAETLKLTYLNKLNKTQAAVNNLEGGGMMVLEVTIPPGQAQTSRAITPAGTVTGLTLGAYPNPVKNNTLIKFTLVKPGPVKVILYNMLGQQVQTLLDEIKELEGEYFINLPTANLAVGVYNCVLETNSEKITTKILRIPG